MDRMLNFGNSRMRMYVNAGIAILTSADADANGDIKSDIRGDADANISQNYY